MKKETRCSKQKVESAREIVRVRCKDRERKRERKKRERERERVRDQKKINER